jgi:hypothetical protein
VKLIDTNRYYLKGTNREWLHIATVQDSLKEYICFTNVKTKQVFIESITGGHLEYIPDDALAQELNDFLVFNGVLDMSKPLLPDTEWYKKPSEK